MSYCKNAIFDCLEHIAVDVSAHLDNVNRGGCAVYAVELAKRMEARGIPYSIRSYSFRDYKEVNIATIENDKFNYRRKLLGDRHIWECYGVYFDHVCLEIGGFLWDSDGPRSNRNKTWNYCYILQPGSVSLEAMQKMAARKSNWNSAFCRSQVPKMRRIMDKHFSKLVKK